MVRLVLLLLGVDYLRKRSTGLTLLGILWIAAGAIVFVDALDGALYFPINFFAYLFLTEGLATLAVAGTGVGGQRLLRYIKGVAVVIAAMLILGGHHHGHFILSMIFGTLFLADGLLQSVSAYMVRFARWRICLTWGVLEILLAVFFYQPYPTHYVGTLPYCLGLFLIFGGVNLMMLAIRVRALTRNPAFAASATTPATPPAITPETTTTSAHAVDTFTTAHTTEWDGPPTEHERALTVHIWTPTGSSKGAPLHYPVIDRYIAAVDVNGVISTGHAALETPEGIYISLYPGIEIDRSPEEFARLLRATRENDIPGIFQTDYVTESKAWCPSTVRVRIRNYDAAKLADFWSAYQAEKVYNLTHRNCSSSVALALEAAIDGAFGRLRGDDAGWGAFLRVIATPELWVAAQIRKRAITMAWTPGLALDYARALSMLADPRPFAWWKVSRRAVSAIARMRKDWRAQDNKTSKFE